MKKKSSGGCFDQMINCCYWYAWRKYRKEGGYISWRISIRAHVPHAVHRDIHGNISHFVPLKRTWWSKKFGIPAPIFRGRIATDDDEYKRYQTLRISGYTRRQLMKMDAEELKQKFDDLQAERDKHQGDY